VFQWFSSFRTLTTLSQNPSWS